MNLVKKGASFLFHYVLAIFIANLAVGILSLILKILLVTVQGPTMITWILEIGTYYIALSFAFFFLFRSFGIKQRGFKRKEIFLAAFIILILHLVIVFTAEWPTVWNITTGSSSLTVFLYTRGGYLESMRDIPRLYYFIALLLEDLISLVFSTFGFSTGSLMQKNAQNERKYPFKTIIK